MKRKWKNKPCVPMVGSPGSGYSKRRSWVYSRAPFINSAMWTLVDLDRFPSEKSWSEFLKSSSEQHKEHIRKGSTKLQNFFIIFVAKQLHFGAQVEVSQVSQGRIKTGSVSNWSALEISGLGQRDTSLHPWATNVHCNMSSHSSPGQLQLELIAHHSAPQLRFS